MQTLRALSLIPAIPLAFLFSTGACRLQTVAAQRDSNILGVFIVASILPIALGILIGKMVSWRYSKKAMEYRFFLLYELKNNEYLFCQG